MKSLLVTSVLRLEDYGIYEKLKLIMEKRMTKK